MNGDSVQQAGQLAGEASDGIGLLMFGKTAVSLLVVIAIILICAWLLKRIGPNRRTGSQHLRVVASTPVGQRERVVIVAVENRWLVLGVGGGQVTKLDTIEPPPETPTSAPLSGSFSSRLRQAMQHNARQLGRRRNGNNP